MKKFIYFILTLSIISCGTTKTESNTPEISKESLKGTWKVTNIQLVGNEGVDKSNLFDMADFSCFNESEWVFIPNNGSGQFMINGSANCEEVATRIHWSFYEPGDGTYQFQFKYVDEKNKPIDSANRGYRSKIEQIEDSKMVMRVKTVNEGNSFDVIINFTKVSEDIDI
jgi:hypothetical protein